MHALTAAAAVGLADAGALVAGVLAAGLDAALVDAAALAAGVLLLAVVLLDLLEHAVSAIATVPMAAMTLTVLFTTPPLSHRR
jgi:hypothetical protein